MLNSVLLSSAAKVISGHVPTRVIITARFISGAEGATFSFYPMFIDHIDLNFDYADSYGDEIDLTMTIRPKDYALMVDQGQDLLCILTKVYTDQSGNTMLNIPPVTKQYHVVIADPRDIRLAAPDIEVISNDPSEQVTVRLLDEVAYKLRNTRVNTVYQKATVQDAIYGLTQDLGIEKIHMVKPDNTHEYDHISIGSYQGISSAYGFLQSTCGVYFKGINAYITGGTLFVYPPYETDPVYDKTAIFYQVDAGRYAGSGHYHKVQGSEVSIVVNTQPQSTDLSINGSENIGTGVIMNRASRALDGVTTLTGQEGAQFTENQSLMISLKNPRTAVGQRNNIRHIQETDNPFPAMSEMISHQASLMTLEWPEADPSLLDPCHRILYYYDKAGTMVKKTGILERAMYQYQRQQKMGDKFVFKCVGILQLRLSPNETVVL